MKRVFTLLLIMAISGAYAQNVGIGTREPKNKLHVAGGVRIDSLATQKDSGLILHNAMGDLFSLKLTGNKQEVLRGDGTFSAAAAPTDAWLLGGNAGTDSSVNFLGTTDNQPLMLRVNSEFFGTLSKYNIAFGREALGRNVATGDGGVSGLNNVAIGDLALWVIAGKENVGVGHQTMANISGDFNTTLGAYALSGNRDGNGSIGNASENVAVGRGAMRTLHGGMQNTAVGAGTLSGFNADGVTHFSANTAIGFEAMNHYAAFEGPPEGNNVAVGMQTLFNNRGGSENTAIGYHALYSDESSFNLTAVGSRALFANTTGEENTAVGYQSLWNNTAGNRNTAIGYASLSTNTTGNNNTAIGRASLLANSTGQNNTATGNYSLRANTTGLDNTATGHSALQASTTGNYNTANGSQSLLANSTGSYNSAYGFKALFTNTVGANNTASGFKALNFNKIGSRNAAFGFEALNTNTTGNNNTALGYRADVTTANLTNATAIGFEAKVNASNKVRIGNAAVTVIEGQVPFTTPSDGRFKYNVKEDVRGLAFILKLRPVTYQFDVKSFDNVYNATYASTENNAYEKAAAIKRTGFIAQEVELAAQESKYDFSGIVRPENETEHYSLSYESFVVPLVKAVQEQQAIIIRQQAEIDELKQLVQKVLSKSNTQP